MSDPTSGPRILTPGSVRGSLTSRLLAIGIAPIYRMESAAEAHLALRRKYRTNAGGSSLDIIRITDGLKARLSSVVEWELSFTPHAELRMEQRGVTEVEVRAMLERATAFEPSVVEGRFMIRVARDSRPWIVIVEPDNDASLLVVVTAYEVSE